MAERKYSIAEIDRMRRSLEWMRTPVGRGFNAQELRARVEDELRTYMANGTDPEEIESASARHQPGWHRIELKSVAVEQLLRDSGGDRNGENAEGG